MAASRDVTPLGYALLGLCRAGPRSGYALRKVFETTPLGSYSSSPGSIYPALKALEAAGLVERRPTAAGKKQVFAATEAGAARFDAWLTRPVEEVEVARHLDTALLRFAFLQGHPDPQPSLDFLGSFEAGAQAHAQALQAYLDDAGHTLPLHGRLAVEHGLASIRCSARWAADARRRLIESTREAKDDES